jgi:hypothetical protein
MRKNFRPFIVRRPSSYSLQLHVGIIESSQYSKILREMFHIQRSFIARSRIKQGWRLLGGALNKVSRVNFRISCAKQSGADCKIEVPAVDDKKGITFSV